MCLLSPQPYPGNADYWKKTFNLEVLVRRYGSASRSCCALYCTTGDMRGLVYINWMTLVIYSCIQYASHERRGIACIEAKQHQRQTRIHKGLRVRIPMTMILARPAISLCYSRSSGSISFKLASLLQPLSPTPSPHVVQWK